VDYDELLDRAKWGKVSPQELARVADELANSQSSADRYTLLLILGKAQDHSHRELVESFLKCREDPMLARLALQILCEFWGLTEEYLAELVEFVHGVPWDVEDDVRLVAISIAGEYLRTHGDNDTLMALLHIFDSRGAQKIVREVAYRAIARSMGSEWQDLPSSARHFDLVTDVDGTILERARRRAGAKE